MEETPERRYPGDAFVWGEFHSIHETLWYKNERSMHMVGYTRRDYNENNCILKILLQSASCHAYAHPQVRDELWDVRAIFSSQSAFAALRNDGRVVTWGLSQFGGDSSSVQETWMKKWCEK